MPDLLSIIVSALLRFGMISKNHGSDLGETEVLELEAVPKGGSKSNEAPP
jgi:hypothetical protein